MSQKKPYMCFLVLYFYHLYNIIFLVLCTRPCWVNPCPFHSVPQGTLYWNCWSYRTFALMEVSPQSLKSDSIILTEVPICTTQCSLFLERLSHYRMPRQNSSPWLLISIDIIASELICLRYYVFTKKMPSDRSKVEMYYFLFSLTARNKFLAGTIFLSSNY